MTRVKVSLAQILKSIFGQSTKYVTNQDYAMLRSKNYQYILKIKAWLYGQYALTNKGIFKFSFLGYYAGKNRVYYADVILPKPTTNSRDGNPQQFKIPKWVLKDGVEE